MQMNNKCFKNCAIMHCIQDSQKVLKQLNANLLLNDDSCKNVHIWVVQTNTCAYAQLVYET